MQTTHQELITLTPNARALDTALANSTRSVAMRLSGSLSSSELTRLYRGIENALPDQAKRVVQFVSAYEGEGANAIAFETAAIAATWIGRRVLIVDTSLEPTGASRELAAALTMPLDRLVASGRPLNDALVHIAGTSIFYTHLRTRGEGGFPLASLDVVEMMLQSLKPSFDLIVLHSAGILTDVFGTALSKLVDGSIIVVEAERTRGPVALEIKSMIQANGGRVIGAILNKRRFYIPQRLYRWLYRSGPKA